MRVLVMAYGIFFSLTGSAQQVDYSIGGSMAMAETGVATTDAFAAFNNPSALSSDSTYVGLVVTQHYLVEGLQQATLAGSTNTNFGSVGVGFHYFGDEYYHEATVALAFNRAISDQVTLGASIHYASIFAMFADRAQLLYPQLGVTAQLTKSFQLAATVKNPFRQQMTAPFEENMAASLSLGGQYFASETLQLSIQSDIVDRHGFSSAFGLHYRPYEQFSFQFGGRLHPNFISTGLSFYFDRTNATIGSQYQHQLGYSPFAVAQHTF